jgi:hypothetical protein
MKHPILIALALLLALVTPLSQAGATAAPLTRLPGDFQSPKFRPSSNGSVVKFLTVVSSRFDYGNSDFKPAAGASTERPRQENVASLADGARILGVSSNLNDGDNSSEFGALKAIDGLDNTEWASNGDGNNAWIEIGLEQKYNIDVVGFRSRKTPDGNGQVSRFTVTTDQGQTAGPFQLPNSDRIYYFPVQITAHALRFKTVETSGGNAGAVAIEAFGAPTP